MLTFREIELINIKHFEPRGCVIIGRVMKVMKGWGHNMNILLQYFVQVTGGGVTVNNATKTSISFFKCGWP